MTPRVNRSSVRKAGSKLLTVWVPGELAEAVDVAVAKLDSDKSKFTRKAIREKLGKLKIPSPPR